MVRNPLPGAMWPWRRKTLRLAKGFERIDGQVSQALDKRNNPQPVEAEQEADKPRRAPRRNRSRKSPAKAESKS